jgi:hypothetical protein
MMKARLLAVVACVLALGDMSFAGPFGGWKVFATFEGGDTWYYNSESLQPFENADTGKLLEVQLWAGWKKQDGSYSLGRYLIDCKDRTFSADGFVNGDASGKEDGTALANLEQPYGLWALRRMPCSVSCRRHQTNHLGAASPRSRRV